MTLSVKLRRADGDYSILSQVASTNINRDWKKSEFVIEATESYDRARIDFHNSTNDSIYWLDDVSFRPVLSKKIDSLPESNIVYAMSNGIIIPPSKSAPSGWITASQTRMTSTIMRPYQWAFLFPAPAISPSPSKTLEKASIKSTRMFRVGAKWIIEGLDSPAFLYNLQGQRIAVFTPDTDGKVIVPAGMIMSPCIARSGRSTFALFPIH